MSELRLIKELEEAFRFPLHRVEHLDNLFEENFFLTEFGYALWDMEKPYFPHKGVRNYCLDEIDNVIGLAVDFCPMYLLENDFLLQFSYLKKLKIKNTSLRDYSVLGKLKSLSSLDLSNNNLSDTDFLRGLTSLSSLNLSGNKLLDTNSLRGLTSLSSLDLSNNNLSDTDSLRGLTSLSSLNLSGNKLVEFRNRPERIETKRYGKISF